MNRARSVVAVLLTVSACYKYVPETAPAPTLGVDYRAHLSEAGTVSLAPYLGAGTVAFDGRLLEEQGNAWKVAVNGTLKRGETRTTIWQGEHVTVARGDVASFDLRSLDRRRTIRAVVLGSAGALAVSALLYAIGGKVSGEPGGGTQPPPAVR